MRCRQDVVAGIAGDTLWPYVGRLGTFFSLEAMDPGQDPCRIHLREAISAPATAALGEGR
jgi:hypothetical protein